MRCAHLVSPLHQLLQARALRPHKNHGNALRPHKNHGNICCRYTLLHFKNDARIDPGLAVPFLHDTWAKHSRTRTRKFRTHENGSAHESLCSTCQSMAPPANGQNMIACGTRSETRASRSSAPQAYNRLQTVLMRACSHAGCTQSLTWTTVAGWSRTFQVNEHRRTPRDARRVDQAHQQLTDTIRSALGKFEREIPQYQDSSTRPSVS
jgi:hypothetical protein